MSDLSERRVVMTRRTLALAGQAHRTATAPGTRWTTTLRAVSEDERILLTLKEVEGVSLKELETYPREQNAPVKVPQFIPRTAAHS